MKVFLVVLAVWEMAYRGQQITPAFVQEMPSMAACESVKVAIQEMGFQVKGSYDPAWTRARCVQVPQ